MLALFESQSKPNEINQYDFMCLLILANQIEDDLGLEVSNFTRVERTDSSDFFRVVARDLSVPESA